MQEIPQVSDAEHRLVGHTGYEIRLIKPHARLVCHQTGVLACERIHSCAGIRE